MSLPFNKRGISSRECINNISTSNNSKVYISNEFSFPIDYAWSGRLFRLLRASACAQYQLACISTLGGAYHLTNRPREALYLAKRQEFVGRSIGAQNVVVRAKVYQAINLALLGRKRLSDDMFAECRRLCDGAVDLLSFCDAAENWLRNANESENPAPTQL